MTSKLFLALVDRIEDVGPLDFGTVDWLLEWLEGERESDSKFMLYDRIAGLIEDHATPRVRQAFLDEFNSENSKYMDVLAQSILLKRADLTTDMFSKNAISFLLSRLTYATETTLWGSLLGRCATETFVEDHLLEFISTTDEPFNSNLRRILEDAGRRHGRRYIRT